MKEKPRKDMSLMVTGIVLVILLIIGVSYAYWSITHTQTNTNVVKTGCFNITFTSGSGITMNNALPIKDIDGKVTTPYHFTITNTCNSPASYQINLERLNTSTLASEYVKAVLNKQGPRLLTNYDEVETTISTATNSYKLYKGTLQPLQTKEYDLRIWMDYDTTTIQGSNKTFSSKIVIISVPKIELPVLMSSIIAPVATSPFLNGDITRDKIETVTFMNTKEVPLNVLGSWDVSKAQNGSVIAWYKDAASGTFGMYDVWIGGSGGVAANANSYYLFSNIQNLNTIDFTYFDVSTATNMVQMFYQAGRNSTTFTIENLSNWDVSGVTSMNFMFADAGRNSTTFTIGDLSNWDVSNVKNMSYMFNGVGRSSTTFILGNLNNWDVSSVTNMGSMFDSAGRNSTTFAIGDLSSWDVSSVEDMKYMFWSTGYNSTSFALDLSNWDVSSVEDMGSMFDNTGRNSTTFTVGDLSNWDVSSVEDMQYMFYCAGYKSTNFNLGDLSNWNVSNVKNMSSMFDSAGHSSANLTLNLSNWDIGSVTDMTLMFFGTSNLIELRLDNWNNPTVTNTYMFNESNNNPSPDNLKIYVKNSAMETWVKTGTNFPANAQVIIS